MAGWSCSCSLGPFLLCGLLWWMGKRPALSLASVQRAEGVTLFAFPWDFEEDTGASIVQDFSSLSLRS